MLHNTKLDFWQLERLMRAINSQEQNLTIRPSFNKHIAVKTWKPINTPILLIYPFLSSCKSPLFIPLYSDPLNGPRPHHPLLSSNKRAWSGADGTGCAVTGSHSLRQTHSSVHLIGPEWRQKWHPMDTERLVIKLQAFVLLSIFSAGFAQSFSFFFASPFPEGKKL